jgi:hypothetical protein
MATLYANNGYFYNNVYAGYSDERLKIKTFNLSNCLSKLCTLSTFQYYPNTSLFKDYDIPFVNKAELGLSAQELLPMFPEIVSNAPCDIVSNDNIHFYSRTGLNLLTVQYEKLIPVIINAIQELSIRVEKIESNNHHNHH